MGIKPTEEQMFPVDLAVQGKDSKTVAYAGTGKSTTLNLAATKLIKNNRVLYVTFGKENIRDANKKFPNQVICRTAHSLAFESINKKLHLYERSLLVPSLSIEDIMKTMKVDLKDSCERDSVIEPISIAVGMINSFCKTTDQQIQKTHAPDSEEPVSSMMMGEAIRIAKNHWHKASEGLTPVTHDMYLKMWHLSNPTLNYDVIMFDEAQDADALMADIVNKQNAMKMVVGDHHQQIYSFRGAINALEVFDISNECYITKSFRYGPKVAEICNELMYQHKGIITEIKGNPLLDTQINSYNHNGPTAVIGRTVSSLFKEMTEDVKGGRSDFATKIDVDKISEIIYNLFVLRNPGAKDKQGNLLQMSHPFLKGFASHKEFQKYSKTNPTDKFPTYDAIISSCKSKNIMKIMKVLKNKNRDRKSINTIYLTAHKSKGLEFENVRILDDFVAPIKRENSKADPKYSSEETNLLYVAATRGMKNLLIRSNFELDRINKIRLDINFKKGAA